MKTLFLPAGIVLAASTALSQTTTQVQLNYNFNGIVHANEAGLPDDLTGYRSISDRGLDFSAGVPNDALLNPFAIVAAPGVLDIVHLGNRNLVSGGIWAFDAVVDADDIGVQPTWLTSVDQSTTQTSVLAAPVVLESTSSADFLYQISNGGGSFDVTFGFQAAASVTAQLTGGDWFGGAYLGTGATDSANPDNNLSITSGSIDLSAYAGQTLTSIAFENSSNGNAGIAILAANVVTSPTVQVVNQIPLSYNFNGIVHGGEAGLPDDLTGYRSISDRGLDFSAMPSNAVVDAYLLVDTAGTLDIVHLGNRNLVDNGNWAFDAVVDGDGIGVQPSWLANVDQSTPQTTVLGSPIQLSSSSEASFLYQISNGGGSFDVTFGFQSGGSVTAQLSGGDWFGGVYLGTGQVDLAAADNNLSITEGTVDLSASLGEILTEITFSNQSNQNAGYAILAANVTGSGVGTSYCGPAVPNSTTLPGVITANGTAVAASNDVTLIASQLPQNQFGYFLNSMSQGFIVNPGGSQGIICVVGSVGRYNNQIFNSGAAGVASIDLDLVNTPTPGGTVAIVAGETWNFQAWYRDLNPGTTSNFTDALSITFQ